MLNYKILFLLLIGSVSSIDAQIDCSKLGNSFSNYESAHRAISSSRFQLTDKANTYKSSWIRGANYYSCDGQVGYFYLKTDSKNYIFKNVPLKIWNGFKNAPSHGKFYDDYIRNRYYFYISQ
jgi:hypothetical protein